MKIDALDNFKIVNKAMKAFADTPELGGSPTPVSTVTRFYPKVDVHLVH